MHSEVVSQQTKRVLEKVGQSELAPHFYLAGGTALALQIGHRQSIDLDWFSGHDFSNAQIKNSLSGLGVFELTNEAEGTIEGVMDQVRVSFFRYRYDLLFPLLGFEKIKLADERDIAAMKIDAISSRGSKKDFIDLYFLLEKYSLKELIEFFEKKYRDIKYNKLHILKSLVYFDDAENEPSPAMLKIVKWETVRETIKRKANEFLEV